MPVVTPETNPVTLAVDLLVGIDRAYPDAPQEVKDLATDAATYLSAWYAAIPENPTPEPLTTAVRLLSGMDRSYADAPAAVSAAAVNVAAYLRNYFSHQSPS